MCDNELISHAGRVTVFRAVTLAKFSTMRLGGPAAHLVEIRDGDELEKPLPGQGIRHYQSS